MTTTDTTKKERKIFAAGCIIPLAALTLLLVLLAVWMIASERAPAPPPYITAAEKKVEKRIEELNSKAAHLKKSDYDIDTTVMTLFSIEKALKNSENFEQLTSFVIQKDSDLAAPDVTALKYRFFNIYKKLLDDNDDMENISSIYKVTSDALTDITSVIGYDAVSGVTFDREQATQIWQKRLAAANAEKEVKERLRNHQTEMLDLLFDFGKINARYIREWNKLCSLRDRAYLAFYEKDLDEAVSSASAAAKLAPHEKEAHILLARALTARNNETDTASAEAVLNRLLKDTQGQQAPAYLLRGVIELEKNDFEKAALDFDQAAAYYPRQQTEISDKLNLYKKRLFLNKSKEGRMIINMYRGIMTGSGFFSPDFQQARIFLKKGDKEKTRKKIFDHFFRRRLQGQWDRVLDDFRFCAEYLRDDFREIFESNKLTLSIEPAWFRNTLIVTVKNNGTTPVHNLTLLLCVRFTDMFKGDYISFPVGESVAMLPPGESVEVGRENISGITEEKLGTVKKWKDIIEYGAILISDEIIAWIAPETPKQKVQQKNNSLKQ